MYEVLIEKYTQERIDAVIALSRDKSHPSSRRARGILKDFREGKDVSARLERLLAEEIDHQDERIPVMVFKTRARMFSYGLMDMRNEKPVFFFTTTLFRTQEECEQYAKRYGYRLVPGVRQCGSFSSKVRKS